MRQFGSYWSGERKWRIGTGWMFHVKQMDQDLQIIVCCDGSVKVVKPNGEVSTFQLLKSEVVRAQERESPYRDLREMFRWER